jgi:hypothetical protein
MKAHFHLGYVYLNSIINLKQFSLAVGIVLVGVTALLWNGSHRNVRSSIVTRYEDVHYDPEEDAL